MKAFIDSILQYFDFFTKMQIAEILFSFRFVGTVSQFSIPHFIGGAAVVIYIFDCNGDDNTWDSRSIGRKG